MTHHTAGDDGHDADTPHREPGIVYEFGEDERPSEAVVRTVASFTNTNVLDLDPLHDVVDPESLDSVFEAADEGPVTGESVISFAFAGCEVTVTQATVRVRELNGADQ